jgi:hypothetical protein
MLKLEKTYRILGAFVLLILLFLVFALSRGIFSRHDAQHQLYIPLQAKSVITINSESFIRTFFSEIVLNPKSDVNFKDFLDTPSEQQDFGVDIRSDFYIFTHELEGKEVMGVLCHVLDETKFIQGLKSSAAKETGFSVKNGVGLILFHAEESGTSRKEMSDLAKKMLETKSGFDLKNSTNSGTKDTKISYWSKNYSSTDRSISLSDIHITLSIESNRLEIDGKANYRSSLPIEYWTLKKEDLSIQTAIIPNSLNELWVRQMTEIGFRMPKIATLSGNYHYAEPSGIAQPQILPHFDGIYSFEDSVNVYLPLLALSMNDKISELTTTYFKLGEKTIYYAQIDPKTIYFGQTKFSKSQVEKSTIFEVSGSLKHLLEIRNGGMMTRMLSLSDQYNALEQFVSGIQDSHFSMRKKGEDQVTISANIEFKKSKSAMAELVGFMLRL